MELVMTAASHAVGHGSGEIPSGGRFCCRQSYVGHGCCFTRRSMCTMPAMHLHVVWHSFILFIVETAARR
jgi:hypothetical protein